MKGSGIRYAQYDEACNQAMRHLQNCGFLEDEHKELHAKYKRTGGDKMMWDCIHVQYEAIHDKNDTRESSISSARVNVGASSAEGTAFTQRMQSSSII